MSTARRHSVPGTLLRGLGVLLLSWLGCTPAPPEVGELTSLPIVNGPGAPRWDGYRPLKILVWNIQFGAGRSQRFFYDGGPAVQVDPAVIPATLQGIVEAIRRHNPDLVLLQEVDRDSQRTGFLDQHAYLAEHLGLPCHTSAAYHRSPFVPYPFGDPLGPVDLHLSVFSRYQLERAERRQLPLLDESWLRQQFNLRRAVLDVRLPADAGPELVLLHTHLSAFGRGDGTLNRQIAAIVEHVGRLSNERWLVAGDFNALPPGDDPSRLGEEAALYPEAVSPLAALLETGRPSVPLATLLEDPQPFRTYLPFGATEPDRTIDWLVHGAGLQTQSHLVDQREPTVSDHLPLVVTLLPTQPSAPSATLPAAAEPAPVDAPVAGP